MSKEQIEEMAKAMCGNGMSNGICATDDDPCHLECVYGCCAEKLYAKGYRKIPDNIGEFSDGYHTFNELYHHRAVLFSVICNMFPEKAWKSKLHDTGDMFDGMFIVGIETEQGQATYHYDIEPYWDMFNVKELEKAPKWDGHTPSDAIQRIGNISSKQSEGEWITKHRHRGGFRTVTVTDSLGEKHTGMVDERWECDDLYCSICGKIAHDAFLNYCANCGAKMKGGAG